MDWVTDFRGLPGGCTLGFVAVATSPLGRDGEAPLRDDVARRARGRRPLDLTLRFRLWVLAHYDTATSREAVGLAVPKLLAAQRADGLWEFEPYRGGGAGLSMMDGLFPDPACSTYRVLETLHLAGLLPSLVASRTLRGRPFRVFRRRRAIGALVARRDFERRPAKRDAQLAGEWAAAILGEQAADGSWEGSPTLTAHALHLLADLSVPRERRVQRALKWLRGQFRHNAALPPHDRTSRMARPTLCTFGATTDPVAELTALRRIAPTTHGACSRRTGGAQSALVVWALNRWGQGSCPEAQAWVEQTRCLRATCGNFASRVFLRLRHRAGEIELSPRERKACSRPEVVAVAERLLAVRPDLPRGGP